jgi:transcriptional regulator with XRE-family HTH domain
LVFQGIHLLLVFLLRFLNNIIGLWTHKVNRFFEISPFFINNFSKIVDFTQLLWYNLARINEEVTPMDKPNATISQRLREALAAAGKKQADLVRETGLDRGSISSYLSGKYEPKQKAIYKMAQALDVSEAWLLGYNVPMARTPESKKNDQLAKLIVKLRTDADFYETVVSLAELNESQYRGIKQLIAAFNE